MISMVYFLHRETSVSIGDKSEVGLDYNAGNYLDRYSTDYEGGMNPDNDATRGKYPIDSLV